jgi:hypothetical protein
MRAFRKKIVDGLTPFWNSSRENLQMLASSLPPTRFLLLAISMPILALCVKDLNEMEFYASSVPTEKIRDISYAAGS